MKKTSLAIILALASATTAFQAMAAENAPTQDKPAPMMNHQDIKNPPFMPCPHANQMGQHHHKNRHEKPQHPHHVGFIHSKEAVAVNTLDKVQDDSVVLLQGNLIKQVGKNTYLFKDASGEMELIVPRHHFRGMISPQDEVKIVAEVEKSFGKTEVEAMHIFPNKEKMKKFHPANAPVAPVKN